MNRGIVPAAILAFGALGLACQSSPTVPQPEPRPLETSTVTDGEGHTYSTVRIGGQWWMAENLRATRGRDGAILDGVYAFGDREVHVADYGRLYTWNAARAPIVPGWHLPSETEWRALLGTAGPTSPGAALRRGGATGFNAVFGGFRFYDGSCDALGTAGHYWTSTPYTDDHAWKVTIYATDGSVPVSGFGMAGAISVRLVRDE